MLRLRAYEPNVTGVAELAASRRRQGRRGRTHPGCDWDSSTHPWWISKDHCGWRDGEGWGLRRGTITSGESAEAEHLLLQPLQN
jgi:hypothetical protein